MIHIWSGLPRDRRGQHRQAWILASIGPVDTTKHSETRTRLSSRAPLAFPRTK